MEAYAIAKVCYLHNVDFISYKYITDDGSADDWVSNCHMGTKQFKEVQDFFTTMPKLKHDVTIKNPKTKKESNITLTGLNDFFA